MDAMIFAAGLGTRLRPLTNDRPKALVEIGGKTILERVAQRLIDAGAGRIVINTHHFPERIADLVRERDGFGVDVRISHEPGAPLDTGGGLRQAAPHFRRDRPIMLHNCDVISDVDLRALYTAHEQDADAVATLAVLPPSAERYLVFDSAGLCGYSPRGGGDEVLAREPVGEPQRHDFTGIHVISPELLDTLKHDGAFSIITHYLSLAGQGRRIGRYEQPDVHWTDIGSHEQLAVARAMLG
jgi:NDP-sugar pyrophosphorylase family protein